MPPIEVCCCVRACCVLRAFRSDVRCPMSELSDSCPRVFLFLFLRVVWRMAPCYLYALKLQGNRVYVGTTERHPTDRLDEHMNSAGSEWTRRYSPDGGYLWIRMIPSHGIPGLAEDAATKEMMLKYGIDNVRGGSYSHIHLDRHTLRLLNRELWHAQGNCVRCGRSGHWAEDCFARIDANGTDIASGTSSPSSSYSSSSTNSPVRDACFRCGHTGHFASECYATWHVMGYRLPAAGCQMLRRCI